MKLGRPFEFQSSSMIMNGTTQHDASRKGVLKMPYLMIGMAADDRTRAAMHAAVTGMADEDRTKAAVRAAVTGAIHKSAKDTPASNGTPVENAAKQSSGIASTPHSTATSRTTAEGSRRVSPAPALQASTRKESAARSNHRPSVFMAKPSADKSPTGDPVSGLRRAVDAQIREMRLGDSGKLPERTSNHASPAGKPESGLHRQVSAIIESMGGDDTAGEQRSSGLHRQVTAVIADMNRRRDTLG